MCETIPYHSAREGDVIDDRGRLAVITHVEKEKTGSGVILSLSADGTAHRLEWRQGTPSGLLRRVGKHCAATSEGLRHFILQQLS
jgi:hypothetical protein